MNGEHEHLTIEEYDLLHTLIGIGPEWLASERRAETIAEIAAGVGPLGLRATSPAPTERTPDDE